MVFARINDALLLHFQVLVMTPQILLDGLRHSFFRLDFIKVLIFDECHHARGKHAYACILTVSVLFLSFLLLSFNSLRTFDDFRFDTLYPQEITYP